MAATKICKLETPCKDLSTCPHLDESPDLISFKITPLRDPEFQSANQLSELDGVKHPESSCNGNGEVLKGDLLENNGETPECASPDDVSKSNEDGKEASNEDEKAVDQKEELVVCQTDDDKMHDENSKQDIDTAVSPSHGTTSVPIDVTNNSESAASEIANSALAKSESLCTASDNAENEGSAPILQTDPVKKTQCEGNSDDLAAKIEGEAGAEQDKVEALVESAGGDGALTAASETDIRMEELSLAAKGEEPTKAKKTCSPF